MNSISDFQKIWFTLVEIPNSLDIIAIWIEIDILIFSRVSLVFFIANDTNLSYPIFYSTSETEAEGFTQAKRKNPFSQDLDQNQNQFSAIVSRKQA